MSGVLPLIVAAATASTPAEPPQRRNDVSIALPSLDGASGLQVAYERLLSRRISVAGSVQVREAAVGDFTGVRYGVGVEARYYFGRTAMIGWFAGGRLDVAIDTTTDTMSDRSLGTALEIGTTTNVGYRLAPWRGLEITPSVGATYRFDIDVSGRLPTWSRAGLAAGLSVGWMF